MLMTIPVCPIDICNCNPDRNKFAQFPIKRVIPAEDVQMCETSTMSQASTSTFTLSGISSEAGFSMGFMQSLTIQFQVKHGEIKKRFKIVVFKDD
jgi:hypothetical protein